MHIAVVSTYTRELDAAVTALGGCAALLEVKRTQLTTRGLDDPGLVGAGVVPIRKPYISILSQFSGRAFLSVVTFISRAARWCFGTVELGSLWT